MRTASAITTTRPIAAVSMIVGMIADSAQLAML
jgi:hypothetical protein